MGNLFGKQTDTSSENFDSPTPTNNNKEQQQEELSPPNTILGCLGGLFGGPDRDETGRIVQIRRVKFLQRGERLKLKPEYNLRNLGQAELMIDSCEKEGYNHRIVFEGGGELVLRSESYVHTYV